MKPAARPIALLAAGLLAALSAHAQFGAAGTDPTGRSIFSPSGDKPSWERERPGLGADDPALARQELFTVKDLKFAFIDPRKSGQFVRTRDDGAREALVRVESESGNRRSDLLLRAQCQDETFYFGPPKDELPALKPVEKGTVSAALVKKLCG